MLRWVIAALWAGAIAVISLVSSDSAPRVGIAGVDKVAHFIVYAVLAVLVLRATGWSGARRALCVAAGCAVFGLVLEFAQGALTEDRCASAGDMIANALGAVCASVMYVLAARRVAGRAVNLKA